MSMECMAARSGGEEKASMVTATGYCYSEPPASSSSSALNMQAHHVLSFESSNPEIYNLSNGMEMIGFPSSSSKHQRDNNNNSSVMWKEFFGKPGNNHLVGVASSSKSTSGSGDHQFYQDFSNNKTDFSTGISDTTHDTLMAAQDHHHHQSWNNDNRSVLLDDDPNSLRSVVFPCEGTERPSQGLSLSLGNSSNPSSIGVQSFELRHQHHHHQDDFRFGPSSSSRLSLQQQQQQQQMILNNNLHHHHHHHQQGGLFQIRNSKYLGPAQELLNEFCNLETKETESSKMKLQKASNNNNQWQQDQEDNSSKMQSLCSLDLLELQKRKAKLLQMLEEVDRRYKHYCNQMKAVVSSFEAVAGNGAASVYSALASKAMSRHFRCLRDGIVGQIKATKKALGEKDTSIPGTTRGETPRLRILDQTLRQQRAFQQMNMMESHPWRPQRGLPERAVSVLRAWLFEHFLHPYPSDVDKHILARQTGLSRSQVSNWFINARVRLWKPMVEEMYIEETKELENAEGSKSLDDHQNPHHLNHLLQDQKPSHDQLVRIDSECLSSIINNNPNDKNDGIGSNKGNNKSSLDDEHHHHLQQFQSFGRVSSDAFGAVELDFSSFNHLGGGGGAGAGGGGSGGAGVSLTLGLQQHGGAAGGVSLAFSPHATQNSLFYSRDQLVEDCQTVQYSLLESESQNLPYRNLMGAQLLHDLAG